jgi:hypothetical protein
MQKHQVLSFLWTGITGAEKGGVVSLIMLWHSMSSHCFSISSFNSHKYRYNCTLASGVDINR